MNPHDDPELYACIVLAGAKSPGTVTITGAERPQKWDIKDAKGQAGATTTRGSAPPAQFQCTFSLLKDLSVGRDDFTYWDGFQLIIESSTAGKDPVALEIYHPDLQRLGITQVVNAGIGQLIHDGKGGATVTVKFIEFRPPKKKASGAAKPKPAGYNQAIAGANALEDAFKNAMANTSPTAQAEKELDALIQEAKGP